jgi:hypothetical protein
MLCCGRQPRPANHLCRSLLFIKFDVYLHDSPQVLVVDCPWLLMQLRYPTSQCLFPTRLQPIALHMVGQEFTNKC